MALGLKYSIIGGRVVGRARWRRRWVVAVVAAVLFVRVRGGGVSSHGMNFMFVDSCYFLVFPFYKHFWTHCSSSNVI
jgi:hypothetical protein